MRVSVPKLAAQMIEAAARVAVYAFLALVPLGLGASTAVLPHDGARLAQLALALLCAIACVASGSNRIGAKPWPLAAGVLAVVAAALTAASVLHAAVPAFAVREVAMIVGCLCIAATLAGGAERRREFVLVVIAASLLYVGFVWLLVAAIHLGGQRLERAELFTGYDNYRFFNHVQTVALPLLAFGAAQAGLERRWRVAAAAALVGGFALLVSTGGRATLLAIAVGLAAAVVLFGRGAWPLVRATVPAAFAGMLLYALAFVVLPPWTGAMPDASEAYLGARESSVHARYYLWNLALEQVARSPWIGVGPMHFAHEVNLKAAHPHNVYLQVAAEWGLPMLALLLGSAGIALWRVVAAARRCGDASMRLEGIALFATWIAIAVDGAFSGNFVMPVSQVWIAFAAGWTIAWMRAARPEARPSAPYRRGMHAALAAPWVVLALLVWLSWDIAPEARNLSQHLQAQIEKFPPTPRMSPRFWIHGWF